MSPGGLCAGRRLAGWVENVGDNILIFLRQMPPGYGASLPPQRNDCNDFPQNSAAVTRPAAASKGERRLELARKVSQLAGPAVAELAEVLRDLQFLAEPTAAGPVTQALLQATPAAAAAVPAG
jgi:hypothetical protein